MLKVVKELTASSPYAILEVNGEVIVLVRICHIYLKAEFFPKSFSFCSYCISNKFLGALMFIFHQLRIVISLDIFLVYLLWLLLFNFTTANCGQKHRRSLFLILNLSCFLFLPFLPRIVLFLTSLHSNYIQKMLLLFIYFKIIIVLFDFILLACNITLKHLFLLNQRMLLSSFEFDFILGLFGLVLNISH